ncbi:DMT family transporter [Halocatena pleomorpha]|uniref:DMT family transporter n=1 Tax=Halocatena pleomorpha TaxID=1785090 RepID=A0A3P3R901_9EURY|nr:DMT family transporter [Halocatena pleomorpha]RRJ29130.1 DMT family transporter [Halocatena pleomorpha]
MARDSPSVPPALGLLIAVGAVSTSAILIRWSNAPSLIKAFYRVLFTTVLLAPVALLRYRTAFSRLTVRDALGAGIAGFALALHFATWFESLEWTSVAASVTLVQSQPLFVVIGAALLLEEHVSTRTTVGILIALAGMVVMSVGGGGGGGPTALSVYGNALAVVGAVMAAGYVLVGRALRHGERIALLPYVTIVYAVCAVVLLVLLRIEQLPLISYPPREWLLFLGMAIGPGILGHTVINWALAHVESSVVSVSLLGEPVGSTVLALVLLGEFPGVATVVGGTVVLSGIVVTSHR